MLQPSNTLQPLTSVEMQAIETFYAAWKAQNPELLERVCTPDWQDIPLGPGQGPGPTGLGAIITKFTAAFPDVEIIVHEVFGTHERVGVRAEMRFINPHVIPGALPPGSPVSIAMHEFHYLRDGQLTHTWHLEDGAFQPYAVYALS